jgi:hypothetical protein
MCHCARLKMAIFTVQRRSDNTQECECDVNVLYCKRASAADPPKMNMTAPSGLGEPIARLTQQDCRNWFRARRGRMGKNLGTFSRSIRHLTYNLLIGFTIVKSCCSKRVRPQVKPHRIHVDVRTLYIPIRLLDTINISKFSALWRNQ